MTGPRVAVPLTNKGDIMTKTELIKEISNTRKTIDNWVTRLSSDPRTKNLSIISGMKSKRTRLMKAELLATK
jgi:hypothetical protein